MFEEIIAVSKEGFEKNLRFIFLKNIENLIEDPG